MLPIFRPHTLLVLAIATACLSYGCDDPEKTLTPTLRIAPELYLFPKLQIDQEAVRRVELQNIGSGDLVVANLELDASSDEFTLLVEENGALVPPPDRITLATDETIILAVRYGQSDEMEDSGEVTFITNDRDQPQVTIPIQTAEQASEIRVSPRSIDFGQVEVGQMGAQELTISNIGGFDLEIFSFTIDGRQEFSAAHDGESVLEGDREGSMIIPSGESRVIEVTFTPAAAAGGDSTLVIRSNAANEPIVGINLYANGALPCINVLPELVEFGGSLLVDDRDGDTPNLRTVTVESCGPAPLRVTGIEFEAPGDVFGTVNVETPADGPIFQIPGITEGQPFPSVDYSIGFWPSELRAYGGRMLVHSNAPDSPRAVDLFGRGVDNECPLPIPSENTYDVQPLDIITLDGTPSDDPGGEVREWHWTVVERPDGSVSQPVEEFGDPTRPADGGMDDDTGTPLARFFVDLAGRYVLHLRVVDNLGTSSCDPAVAEVIIEAVPEKDLHVQLVWSTPVDPDESDQFGTDVDLHFRHQRGGERWSQQAETWDCYFNNPSPDWGLQGAVEDNPTLDIDDTNGAGPENVNLSDPEVGVTYDVGAIYFRSESTFGDPMADRRLQHESYVTVRIFAKGELLTEFVGQTVNNARQLWHVVSINWCEDEVGAAPRCPEVTVVDQVFEEAEYTN